MSTARGSVRRVAAFVRHGIYEQPEGMPSAHLPHPLTGDGESQARQGADELVGLARELQLPIHPVMHASSLLRAYQTAILVMERLVELGFGPFEVVEHPALAERSVGSLANLTLVEIDRIVARDPRLEPLPKGWKSDSDFRAPFLGAESLLEAGARVARCVEACTEAVEVPEDRLVVFVGHGGSFRHAAVHLGALDRSAVRGLSMFHCRPVLLERARHGSWSHVGGEWKVRG